MKLVRRSSPSAEDPEARLLLVFQDVEDLPVLDALELVAGKMGILAGVQQFLRP